MYHECTQGSFNPNDHFWSIWLIIIAYVLDFSEIETSLKEGISFLSILGIWTDFLLGPNQLIWIDPFLASLLSSAHADDPL